MTEEIRDIEESKSVPEEIPELQEPVSADQRIANAFINKSYTPSKIAEQQRLAAIRRDLQKKTPRPAENATRPEVASQPAAPAKTGWFRRLFTRRSAPAQKIRIESTPARFTETMPPQKINIEGVKKGWLIKESVAPETETRVEHLRTIKIAQLNAYFSTNQKKSTMLSGSEQFAEATRASHLVTDLKRLGAAPQEIAAFEEKVNRDVEDATTQVAMDIVTADKNFTPYPKMLREQQLRILLEKQEIGSYKGDDVRKYILNILKGVRENRAHAPSAKDVETNRFIDEVLARG